MDDYSKTLNLPETDFPMRAGLPEREPDILKYWYDIDIYEMKQKAHVKCKRWILHDGPPYANGRIHMGTALNKILKDIIIKYKYARGYDTPYIPGWDTHGLPIEHAAIKELGLDRKAIDDLTLRKKCKEFALEWLDKQRSDFKRLGVLGDWSHPYVTLDKEFEAEQLKVFGEMAQKGYIYKGKKSVYWCPHCETALAEAEIEYAEQKTPTIFVKMPLVDAKGKLPDMAKGKKVFFLIWTTTPWTMPANVAIALNPKFEYAWVDCDGEIYVLAKDLIETVGHACDKDLNKIIAINRGIELEGLECRHPFDYIDRKSVVILADYVSLETGTGCVHIAPGHGVEDFEIGLKYKLPIICPVDEQGKLTSEAGDKFAGMFVFDANIPVLKYLSEIGMLLGKANIKHQYAHCWRCKNPVIFRATSQWFASIDGFRDQALKSIAEDVQWIPSWGESRIHNMVADRHDWCISRQRTWGVPIPVFYCKDCGEYLVNNATIDYLSKIIEKEGCDAWWAYEANELMPKDTKCLKCGGTEFYKETDIMDVWFDSGSTHRAVAAKSSELAWPVDMYLEGSDQHRGWFQSSLLTSVATMGKAPYRSVLTHGYVVDGDGRKMSKSVGNVIVPQEVIDQYGADIIRLWTASSDYKADIRISPKILKQLSDVYRKIRNTIRYLLGNVYDFDFTKDRVEYNEMMEIDRWALMRLQMLKKEVTDAYEHYDFHVLYHAIHNFCAVEMSAFYLDILKDRLYAEKKNGIKRRSAQTAMYEILFDLVVMLAPILSFTMEEVWQFMKKPAGSPISVQLVPWPLINEQYIDESLEKKWDSFITIRGEVTKVLELARKNKVIGNSLEAAVDLYATGDALNIFRTFENDLPTLLIVSQVKLFDNGNGNIKTEREDLSVTVRNASGNKCERCWIYSEDVGKDKEYLTLCKRCAEVLRK